MVNQQTFQTNDVAKGMNPFDMMFNEMANQKPLSNPAQMQNNQHGPAVPSGSVAENQEKLP